MSSPYFPNVSIEGMPPETAGGFIAVGQDGSYTLCAILDGVEAMHPEKGEPLHKAEHFWVRTEKVTAFHGEPPKKKRRTATVEGVPDATDL